MEQKLLTVDDVAKLLQVKKLSVYKLVYEKRIPVIKISRKMLRFKPEDIEEWLQKLKAENSTVTVKTNRGRKPTKKVNNNFVNKVIEQAKREVLGT